jgi:hypothetical protein
MSWVLLLVLCTVPSDASTCEDRVLAYQLSETECRALAAPQQARGEIVECVPAPHGIAEDDNLPPDPVTDRANAR